MKSAQQKMYDFEFKEARALIEEEILENPSNSMAYYLAHNLLFLSCIGSESSSEFEQSKVRMNELWDKVESDKETGSPWYHLCLGEMHIFQAALYAKYEYNWTAGRRAFSGMKLIQEGYHANPDFIPYTALVGILEVAIGSVPDNYKFLVSWLGFSGTIESGFEKMRLAAQPDQLKNFEYLKIKHFFFYSFSLEHLRPDEAILSSEFPWLKGEDSQLILLVDAKALVSRGSVDEMIALLQSKCNHQNFDELPYLYFLLGKYKVARRDSDGSDWLLRYLKQYQGSQYIKSAYKLLWWDALLRGENTLASDYHKKLLEKGQLKSGADEEAFFVARHPVHLNLVKANLLFDAGKFNQALELLNQSINQVDSRIDKIELNYRFGRVLQAQKRNGLALKYFKLAGQYLKGEPTTFALVNSWLQIGMILESKKEYEEAIQAYKKALRMKGYPYYEGIQQRAKAGLERSESSLRADK